MKIQHNCVLPTTLLATVGGVYCCDPPPVHSRPSDSLLYNTSRRDCPALFSRQTRVLVESNNMKRAIIVAACLMGMCALALAAEVRFRYNVC